MPKAGNMGKPIRVRVARVAVDPEKRTLICLATPKRYLPIWTGMLEGQAIALKMQGCGMARPMTHDLFATTLVELGWQIEKLVVSTLEEQTFYGELHLKSGRQRKVIDCRPSDGVALALRAKASIYVAPKVFELAGIEGPLPDTPRPARVELERPKPTKVRKRKVAGK